MANDNETIEVNTRDIPSEVPVLVNEQFVLYPYMIAPLMVSDPTELNLIDEAISGPRIIGVFAQRSSVTHKLRSEEEVITISEDANAPNGIDVETSPSDNSKKIPVFERIHAVGTVALVLRMLKMQDGSVRLLVHGLKRARIREALTERPYPKARIELIDEPEDRDDVELQALVFNARETLGNLVKHSNRLPEDLLTAAQNTEGSGRLADLIASNLHNGIDMQQLILETIDVKQRLTRLQHHLEHELEIAQLGSKLQAEVKGNIDKMQRTYFLREQLKAIKRELGEGEEEIDDLKELEADLEAANLPEHPRKAADKELRRLRQMSPQSAEFTVARTYLDWIKDLPWSKPTDDQLDLIHAREILDEDHYGLEKVKERILEYLAVIKLRGQIRGPLLCLVGPPGVGKTSLGRSVARAMGRQFVRISLGGVRDEAEIRGHRRTYIGSMPGRIIKSLRDAGSNNPVFMLDEIDKLGMDFRGDPASALLEVLDPQQNSTFVDHYLDVPFDLSNILFITTANSLDPIPGPLQDRMEVLRLAGYTMQEKVAIAQQYLIPRALEDCGLKPGQVEFDTAALETIIEYYTREAGLRNVEREIQNVCRKVARQVAEKGRGIRKISPRRIKELLGPTKFDRDVLDDRVGVPGVAVGLAWTPVGGDILYIECTGHEGKGTLTLTGQLGDVMKESAQAARTCLLANPGWVGMDGPTLEKQNIHVHVPAGAIPKDGPSAGVAMLSAMASLLKGKALKPGIAMTGEITIKGTVLPVGGIKEKVLAAHRSGIKKVLLPARNEKDLIDIPAEVREAMEFEFVSRAEEVLEIVLAEKKARKAAPPKRRRK